MAVEQQRTAESVEKDRKLGLDGLVVGTMDLRQPFLELLWADRSSPEITVLLRSCRHYSKAAPGAGTDPAAACTVDDGWIDLIFGAIAVDGRTRSPGDDRTAASLERTPDQTVDERVFERRQRSLAAGGERDQPFRIVATGMGNGEQDRKIAPRFMNQGWMELAQGGSRLIFVPV